MFLLGKKSFPDDLEAWLCSRSHIEAFTKEAKEIGVEVLGELPTYLTRTLRLIFAWET